MECPILLTDKSKYYSVLTYISDMMKDTKIITNKSWDECNKIWKGKKQ